MPEQEIPAPFNTWALAGIVVLIALVFAAATFYAASSTPRGLINQTPVIPPDGGSVSLPPPDHTTGTSLDYALEHRRSSRDYREIPISPENLSLLLWSAQGITDPATGKRTAPSAMQTYPITLYVAVNNVTGVNPGIYTYAPGTHSLVPYRDAAGKGRVLQAVGQRQVFAAPVTIIMSGNATVFRERMSSSDDVTRHISLEAGHIAQNILLMETSRGMAGVPFTGFNTTAVDEQLGFSGNNHAVYALTAAYPAGE